MAARKSSPAEVLRQARLQSERMVTGMGRRRLMKLLDKAQRDLNKRLSAATGLRGPGADSFTAAQLQVTMRQIQDVITHLNSGVKQLVVDQSKTAADKATGKLLNYMDRAERKFAIGQVLPLKEAEVLDKVSRGAESSALRRLVSDQGKAKPGILKRYGVATIGKFEDTLQLAFATRKPWSDVRAELVEKSPFLKAAPAHWAERIVRTETMGAYNRASQDAIAVAQETLGDMVKILSATFDDRTGWDSYQVHGQIRLTEEPFEWAGRKYMHPPNRPNDREVIVPHRMSWPIPVSLKPKSDGEVSARYYQQRKTGSPSARPTMSTVPLDAFPKA